VTGGWGGRKLALVVVDSLRTDMLRRCVEDGLTPNFAALLARGELVEDCVSTFPSVTPVATAEMTTGVRSDLHAISAVNWFHRIERRYVEYGSSFEATRALGLIRTLYDIVYDMNMSHLSPEVTTVFERLADDGVRTACTPFLIFRGRRRHELGLEGVLRRVAVAASFRHAVWGPDELFYGELYASRKVSCPPTLARPGTRDPYSACVGKELARSELYDFLLFSLPDNDHHSHRFGPLATADSIARADGCLGELVAAWGGIDRFCDEHAVIVCADHAQTEVAEALPLIDGFAERWRVHGPSAEQSEGAEVAVSPCARAGGVYVLADGRRGRAIHAGARELLDGLEGVDLAAWLLDGDGEPLLRSESRPASEAAEAVVERDGRQLRFRPGSGWTDLRGASWDLDGDPGLLGLERRDGALASDAYPDPLGRLWAALVAPNAADLLASLAPGYECVDWGRASHAGGGSHGSLAAGDSLGPLLACGVEGFSAGRRAQWTVADIAGLVDDHFATTGATEHEDVRALSRAR
jgi:Type I phosphodiesterase / nucleotide pyrophosphatase